MNNFISKITSRKFWIALAGVVCGIAMSFGAESTEIQSVCGSVTAIISLVTYIVIEGKVDSERVKTETIDNKDGE